MNNEPVLSAQNDPESIIWEGSQSQIVNFGHFVLTFLMIAAITILSQEIP